MVKKESSIDLSRGYIDNSQRSTSDSDALKLGPKARKSVVDCFMSHKIRLLLYFLFLIEACLIISR